MSRAHLILATAVLCTAVACGGDGDSGAAPSASPSTTSVSPTPSEMTKEAYVAEVNTVCRRVTSEVETVGEPKTADEYESALTKLIDIIDRAQADIKKLTPPAADAAEIQEKFVGRNDEQAAKLKAALPSVQSAAQADDDAAAEKAFGEALTEDDPEIDAWMTSYGLTDCVA